MTGSRYLRKLHDTPNGTHVELVGEVHTPPSSKPLQAGDIVYFDHLDGMYSYCKDKDGDIVHPAAWTKVRPAKPPTT